MLKLIKMSKRANNLRNCFIFSPGKHSPEHTRKVHVSLENFIPRSVPIRFEKKRMIQYFLCL